MDSGSDLTGILTELKKREPGVTFRSGKVTAWDAQAGTNSVNVGGTRLDDLPCLIATEKLAINVGAVVGILRVKSQYFILGRINADEGEIVVRDSDGDVAIRINADRGIDINNGGNLNVNDGGRVTLEGGLIDIQSSGLLINRNADNQSQTRIGELLSIPGTYGIEQRIDGVLVPLSQLGGGVRAATTSGLYSLNESSGGDSGWENAGTGVTFTTYTGKWLIQLTAQCEVSGSRAAARFGFNIAGHEAPDNDRSAMITDPSGAGIIATVSYAELVNGQPGTYTVNPHFRLIAGPSQAAGAGWSNRTIIVTPY